MCLNPKKVGLNTYFDLDGELHKELVFKLDSYEKNPRMTPIQIPCNRCIECVQKKSNEWAFRIMNEASLYDKNCFITLTYGNGRTDCHGRVIDSPVSLIKADFQKFMKRLRKAISPIKVRFFGCGEYGSKGQRPHYHISIFGYDFPDKEFFKYSGKNQKLMRSAQLEKLWPYGFSTVAELEPESAKYVAKYMQKFNKVPEGAIPPFVLMSNRPGIGAEYVKKSARSFYETVKSGLKENRSSFLDITESSSNA